MEPKDWQDFEATGLLWWLNRILHTLGWAIVFDEDDKGELLDVYPARVHVLGFPPEVNAKKFAAFQDHLTGKYPQMSVAKQSKAPPSPAWSWDEPLMGEAIHERSGASRPIRCWNLSGTCGDAKAEISGVRLLETDSDEVRYIKLTSGGFCLSVMESPSMGVGAAKKLVEKTHASVCRDDETDEQGL